MNLVQLTESVTFSVTKFNPERNMWMTLGEEQREIDCRDCEANARYGDPFPNPKCYFCKGTGKEKEWYSTLPDLRTSNANAATVCHLLGVEWDDCGAIPEGQLPAIRRRLIAFKNKGMDHLVRDVSDTQSTRINRDGDVPRIERGPRMIDCGLSPSQLDYLVNHLLTIIDAAQQSDATVGWG